jgi:hypothetical protein
MVNTRSGLNTLNMSQSEGNSAGENQQQAALDAQRRAADAKLMREVVQLLKPFDGDKAKTKQWIAGVERTFEGTTCEGLSEKQKVEALRKLLKSWVSLVLKQAASLLQNYRSPLVHCLNRCMALR